jgi:hypothetical protein
MRSRGTNGRRDVSDKDFDPTHPLVADIVKNPAQPPNLVVYSGFLGPSDEPDKIRLYRNQTLSAWIDIPRDHLVYARRTESSPDNPWGEDVVWIAAADAAGLPPERTGENTVSKPAAPTPPAHDGTWGDWKKGGRLW